MPEHVGGVHIFIKLLSFYCCAFVGINIVNKFTAQNMGIFKHTSSLVTVNSTTH